MAIKANASSQGASSFKKYVGVGSFRVLGVNPTKEELESFYGSPQNKDPEYLKDKVDEKDGNKPYKQLRVSFMICADDPAHIAKENKKTMEANAALTEPFKTTVNFFIDSRYAYNGDKTKVQVIDKYARTAWVTIEQCKNHQIPIYSNGPAKLDKDYRPCFRGEEELTQFIDNYLNITPIETYNRNTGQWTTNPHPEDCEGRLENVGDYFSGDISKLKEYCGYMPDNCVKLLVGVDSDPEGRLFNTVYSRMSLKNGSKNYTFLKDKIDGNNKYLTDNGKNPNTTVWSNDSIGIIKNIEEYNESEVQETNLNAAPDPSFDPFKAAAALSEDTLPFDAPDSDPFRM